MRVRIIGIILLAVILNGGAARSDEVPVKATLDADGVQRVEIVGDSYFFKPSHVIVKVNKPVELSVKKEGWFVPHDFVIDAPEAGITVNESLGGDSKKITFTPTKPGVYPFYCSKKPPLLMSHREKGMEGKLEVVE
jgi:plastocyanin